MNQLIPSHEAPHLQAIDGLGFAIYQGLKRDFSVIQSLLNVDEAQGDILNWLGVREQVDEWNENWEDNTKRRIIKAQAVVHQKKGTVQAVQNALNSIFGKVVKVVEVYRLFGDQFGAYHYDVVVEGQQKMTASQRNEMNRMLSKVAPVRSVLNGVFYRHPYADGTLKYDGTHTYDGGTIA